MPASSTLTAIANVLLPTDFSAESAQAADWVRTLCDSYGANLHVVHVMDIFPFSLRTDTEAKMRMEQIRQTAGAKMRKFVLDHHLEAAGQRTALLAGEPFAAIDKFTTEKHIDLIVLGSKGDTGLSRLFDGSAAEEIFRTARCPVMVVGPKARLPKNVDGFERIVFATDLSHVSRNAVPVLEFLLTKNAHASVTLAHFVQEETVDVFSRHQKRREIERKLARLISPEFRSRIAEATVEVSAPEEGMLSIVEGIAADLLILGVRSGGAFTRAETHGLCSIAPRVISEALCPVLTIRGE